MILIFKSRCAIIVCQSIIIDCKVTWNPIHNYTDIVDMTFLNKVLKLFWTTIGMF